MGRADRGGRRLRKGAACPSSSPAWCGAEASCDLSRPQPPGRPGHIFQGRLDAVFVKQFTLFVENGINKLPSLWHVSESEREEPQCCPAASHVLTAQTRVAALHIPAGKSALPASPCYNDAVGRVCRRLPPMAPCGEAEVGLLRERSIYGFGPTTPVFPKACAVCTRA